MTVRNQSRMSQRLAAQNATILSMLEHGDVSNRQLASVALKYTSRISDLRKAGHNIRLLRHNRATGETWYRLRGEDAS